MKNVFRLAAIGAVALALAGCYVTEKPIITSTNAAWPFAAGTRFTSYSWKDETHSWNQSGTGHIERVSGQYRLVPDGEQGDRMDFLLADLGGGLYAAQAVDNNEDKTIMLDIAKVEGDTVYQYVLMCEKEDKVLADQHIIDVFADSAYSDSCVVSSLDQLHRAFQAKLARGMVPHGKYVITH